MPPRRRRVIGTRNPRAARNRGNNVGQTPYRTQAEQEFNQDVIPPIRTTDTNRPREAIRSRPERYTPAEVREAIDQASQNISPETRQALRRAQWAFNDEELLDYRPTETSSPRPGEKEARPRTRAAGYDAQSGTLFVRFRGPRQGPGIWKDGVGYEYYEVTPREWEQFKNTHSPGQMINRVLDNKPYTPAAW